MLFLQILGGIFLILLGVAGYYGWKLYRAVKQGDTSGFSVALSVLPAMALDLEPANAADWVEVERLKFNERKLKSIGAEHVGYFSVYHGSASIKISLWNLKHQVIAAFYEGASSDVPEQSQFVFEVACKLGGGSLCITSNQHALYDTRPPQHKLVYKKGNNIVDLINCVKQEIPSGQKISKIENPKQFFIDCYEDISEFSWREEQLKSEKVQQKLTLVGVTITDELMDELIEMGVSHSVEVNINKARKLLAKHAKMSADQWEKIRDKLVFVNAAMQPDHLVAAIYDLGGDLNEKQELALDGFLEKNQTLSDPLSAFQTLLQALNIKAKRLTRMDKPIKTEVYLPV